jgi:geranylgeranyl pyrophosphate synthase
MLRGKFANNSLSKGTMENTKVFDDFKRDFNFQSELKDSISILKGGKGFRAIFIGLLSDIFKIEDETSEVISDVTESLHTATLVHDDVIDNADMRRGKESFNHVIDNKKSILLGDYYLAKTIQKISELNRVELVSAISNVLSSLVEGEWLQAGLDKSDWNEKVYKQVAEHKTGSIFSWCLESVLTIKYNEFDKNLVQKIGNDIGLLFQIVDDVLDLRGDDKTRFADLKNGNINYYLLIMQKNNIELTEAALFENLDMVMSVITKEIDELTKVIKEDFTQLINELPSNLDKEAKIAKFNFFVDELANRYKN